MATYYAAPQPNFHTPALLELAKIQLQATLMKVRPQRLLLHITFIAFAFATAMLGGYFFTSPAAGMALTAENISELPMVVAMVGSAVFLVAWAWGVRRLGSVFGLLRSGS